MPDFRGVVHAGLSVRDRHASAAWYQRVLGFALVREFGPGEGIPRVLLLHPGSYFLLGLYNHPDGPGDAFDPRRTGLDHLALAVDDQAALEAWMAHLAAAGVAHSPVRDLGHARFVSFEDPDGIQFELWLTLVPHAAHPSA